MAIINKHIFLCAAAALALAACNTEQDGTQDNGKTPVNIALTFADGNSRVSSRAVDHDFESGDKLVAYLRHAQTTDGKAEAVGSFDKTVTFTVNTGATMTLVDGTTSTYQTSDITASPTLYWDDFTSADNDIRTDGHGLQSLWGYCYNGNTTCTPATPADELTWQVATDQTSGYKTSDLLWSKSQDIVAYQHSTAVNGQRNGLTIPYTHAMSKATIILKVDDTFNADATPFANTAITLAKVNTKGLCTASSATITGTGTTGEYEDAGEVKMYKGATSTDGKSITFEGLFIPTLLTTTDNPVWANVSDVAGNSYEIPLTTDILNAWACTDAAGTLSGTNYQLTVTLSKVKIDVVAQIADWNTQEATGTAAVKFNTDLTNITPNNDLADGTSYDIWRGITTDALTKATTRTYADGTWTSSPEIYWANASTNYYFRGLAKTATDDKITSVGDNGTAVTHDEDILWATTTKHTGTKTDGTTATVEEGAAISPRTSEVPMQFSHAMSKVTFVLQTTDDDASKVDLDGATITMPDMVKAGTISVADGTITLSTSSDDKGDVTMSSDAAQTFIPQSVSGKVVKIMLKDGTTYSYTLSEDASWERGNAYTYTITLSKEAIKVAAFVKNWTVKTGSGDASLDWD